MHRFSIAHVLFLTSATALFFLALGCRLRSDGKQGEDKIMAPDDDMILIDNRSGDEYAVGHIRGAVLIPYTEIGERIGEITMDKAAPIYVYCRSGRRSGIAREELLRLGYQNVINLGAMEKAAETIGRSIVSDGE